MIVRHNTFYFDVLIPVVGGKACAGVVDAPVVADPLVPVVVVEESSAEEAPIVPERPILGPGSSVGALREHLKELGPYFGGGSPTLSVASPPASPSSRRHRDGKRP